MANDKDNPRPETTEEQLKDQINDLKIDREELQAQMHEMNLTISDKNSDLKTRDDKIIEQREEIIQLKTDVEFHKDIIKKLVK